MRRGLSCRFVAFLTAYVVALNLFLPAFALAAAVPSIGGAAAFGVLCSGDEHHGSGGPVGQGPVCPCCGVICGACGPAAPALGERASSAIVFSLRVTPIVFPTPHTVEPTRLHRTGAHAARAPPEAEPV